MASLDDILTTQKNGVVAINDYVTALNRLAGTNNTKEIAAATTLLVKASSGWLAQLQSSSLGQLLDLYTIRTIRLFLPTIEFMQSLQL